MEKRKRERTIKILKMVAVGILLVGIGAVPPPWAIPRILRELTSGDSKKSRKQTRRRFYDLERHKYIRRTRDRYELTERGKSVLTEQRLWDLTIPVPQVWDGTWHLVIFDIPAKRKSVRILFIRHLQNLGLQLYQRSVWISPYPVKETVQHVASSLRLTPYVSFARVSHIDGNNSLIKRFNLSQ